MRKLLFVEGIGDKDFFTKLFEKISALKKDNINIQILIPTDVGATGDGKEQAKAKLVEHINREYSNEDVFLACILDADYGASQDIRHILTKLSEKISPKAGYEAIIQHETSGYYFQSKNEFNNIGIWFMPNNHEQGMLEDWFLKIAKSDENYLINYAEEVCNKIPESQKRFEDIHKTKAQVGIWTALQKSPHLGTENIIIQNLYNENSTDFQNFITWLKFVFKLSA